MLVSPSLRQSHHQTGILHHHCCRSCAPRHCCPSCISLASHRWYCHCISVSIFLVHPTYFWLPILVPIYCCLHCLNLNYIHRQSNPF
uniref:Uncharacterized protein n=1 Tax=Arundo donax TaxID=35708 RepID=A0A0A9DQ48_ARUDO